MGSDKSDVVDTTPSAQRPLDDVVRSVRTPSLLLYGFAPLLGFSLGPAKPTNLAGGASLLLIIGGLSILLLMVVLQLVQTLLPAQPSPLPAGKGRRKLRPTYPPNLTVAGGGSPGVPTVPDAPPGSPAPPVEAALIGLIRQGEGEPRILEARPGFLRLRLYHCLECQCAPKTPARPDAACTSETEILGTALQRALGAHVTVRESTCRRRGQAECEFEVAA